MVKGGELKREALRLLRKKNILSVSEYNTCREALIRVAEQKRDRDFFENSVECELEGNVIQNAKLSSGEKALAFPFFLINSTNNVVCIEDLKINFINSNGKNFNYKHDYYLTRTGPMRNSFLIDANDKVLSGPIALYSDFDYDLDNLTCTISYTDITNMKRIYVLYKLEYGSLWKCEGKKIVPFHILLDKNDIRKNWDDKIEYYGLQDDISEIELSNFNICEDKSCTDTDTFYSMRGEVEWKNIPAEWSGVVIKAIFLDIEERVIAESKCQIELAWSSGKDSFKIEFDDIGENEWNNTHIIHVVKNPIVNTVESKRAEIDTEVLTKVGTGVYLYEQLNEAQEMDEDERLQVVKRIIHTELENNGVIICGSVN